jgi:hypothetical protein
MDLTINEQNFTVVALEATEDPGLYELIGRCYKVVQRLADRLLAADESLFTEISFTDFDSSGPIERTAQLIIVAEHENMRLYYSGGQNIFTRHRMEPESDKWKVYESSASAWTVFPLRKVVDGLMGIKKLIDRAEKQQHEKLMILGGAIKTYLDKIEDEAGLTTEGNVP